MQTIDEVRDQCLFVGKGIEKMVALLGMLSLEWGE